MMLFIDLFAYRIYRLCHFKIGTPKGDAMLSTLAIMSVYIAFFILMLSCLIGYIQENKLSRFILDMDVSFVFVIGLIALVIFRLRYYKYYDIEQVNSEMKALSENKKRIYKYTSGVLYIAIPILGFIFFRLYAFGHI